MPRVIDDDSCVPGGGLGQKALDGLTQRGPGAIHDIPDVIKPLLAQRLYHAGSFVRNGLELRPVRVVFLSDHKRLAALVHHDLAFVRGNGQSRVRQALNAHRCQQEHQA
ncbi:hypothetical protein D3C72_2083420 [compost metagenome]